MKTRFILLTLFIAGLYFQTIGQPARQLVQVSVAPNHADWTYKRGDRAEFTITVTKNNVPLENIEVNYRINPEKMDNVEQGTLTQ